MSSNLTCHINKEHFFFVRMKADAQNFFKQFYHKSENILVTPNNVNRSNIINNNSDYNSRRR